MATADQGKVTLTFVANADLSAKQYYFVKIVANGKCDLAAAGDKVAGVLQNKPTSGQVASVQVSGVTKVVSAGALTLPQNLISSDANGKAVASLTTNNVAGMAMTAPGADTTIFTLLLSPGYKP